MFDIVSRFVYKRRHAVNQIESSALTLIKMNRKVKAQLALLDLTLDDLADACDVSRSLISRTLSNKYAGFEHRKKIASALRLPERVIWPEPRFDLRKQHKNRKQRRAVNEN